MENAMSTAVDNTLSLAAPGRPSRAGLWTGRVLTSVIVLFLVVDAIGKIIPLAPVIEACQRLGFNVHVIRPIGVLLLMCTLLHVVRRTRVLGAVLITAYLGGATATHVLTGTPFWFPVLMGVVLWIAYGLRSPELRAFVLSAR
jgi:hypothetical protein